LRQDKAKPLKSSEEEEIVFGDDYEDLQKSLGQARKLALRKQEEVAGSVPLAVVEMATSNKGQEDAAATERDAQQNKVVITEMEEFVWGLQLSEGNMFEVFSR
jgi:U4/U6.U5 tri-snRNP-associated protein 1